MRRVIKKKENLEELNINMTPFIDVIFSILIAFMVPNQSLFGNIELELPPANVKIAVLDKDPIKILIERDGSIVVNNKKIKTKDLLDVVEKESLKNKNIKIYVMADKKNNYGTVLDLVGKLNEKDFKNVVLISDIYNRL